MDESGPHKRLRHGAAENVIDNEVTKKKRRKKKKD